MCIYMYYLFIFKCILVTYKCTHIYNMNMYVYVSTTRYQHTRKPPEIRLLLPVRPGENLALVEQRDDKARPIHPSDHERGKFVRMPSRSFWLPPVKWNSERALLRRCHHSWLGYGDYAADVTLHGPCCPNEDWTNSTLTERHHWYIPILRTMVLEYLPTFALKIAKM